MELASTHLEGKMVSSSSSSSFALLFFCLSLVFFPLATSGLPLCTDSRAPVPVKLPLSFCSYNGTACCNTTEDSDLQKLFLSMNITDAACSSVVKSLLCKRCDPFSASLFTAQSKIRTVPILCKSPVSVSSVQSKNSFKDYCEQVWDTCKDVQMNNSPFAASLQGSTQIPISSSSKLTDIWQSKNDFCKAFGGSSGHDSICFDGNSVLFNSTENPPSPKGLCLERLWNGSYLNMVAHPDGSNRVFLSNQDGKIWLAAVPEQGSGKLLDLDESNPFIDLSDQVHRDTALGMMGMAFHPDFASNGRFFASFNCDRQQAGCSGRCSCNSEVGCDPAKLGGGRVVGTQPCQYNNVIAEFTANGTSSSPSSATSARSTEVRRILTMGLPHTSNHGGQILFGPNDGYLYFMMGDGSDNGDPLNFAQNKKSLLGKIMRLDVDNMPSLKQIDDLGLWGNYSIPKDNPYIEDSELRPEIWAMGLRNPWRCSFDSERPSYFFCADVGQNTYEEVDLISKGGNYGWRVYEGADLFTPNSSPEGINTTIPTSIDAILPIMGYKHVSRSASISGGYVYRSPTDPCLSGRYLFADLYAISIWTGTEIPENSGNYSSTLIPFSCASDSPIPCESVEGSSLPSLGYIYSFGEDNRKDIYLLTSKGVYRVVAPSRCKYACPLEKTSTGSTDQQRSSSAFGLSELSLRNLKLMISFILLSASLM